MIQQVHYHPVAVLTFVAWYWHSS
eukprot:SAG31_NODE_41227_length_277_cov_0.584270_2_plen_23_part_01